VIGNIGREDLTLLLMVASGVNDGTKTIIVMQDVGILLDGTEQ
jgi:hypothetical protein